MKIVLPSRGVLGIRSVDLRPPTFNDLRNVYNLNQQEGLLKAQFVKGLIGDVDFTKITKFDLEYLFMVAAFSLTFNRVSFTIKCSECGFENKEYLTFGGQDVQELRKEKYPYIKVIDGVTYTYHLLSAQDDILSWEYAMSQEDEEAAYQDACVAFTLWGSIENIDKVKDLTASVYISAIAYQYFNFHGVILKAPCTCEKCGYKMNVRVNATSDMIKVDLNQLMAKYAETSSELSFEAFCDFTMNEYKAFVDAINSRS